MPDPAAVQSMFSRIAGRYDLLNRIMSLGLDKSWRKTLVQMLIQGHPDRILDVATGTVADGDVVVNRAGAGP